MGIGNLNWEGSSPDNRQGRTKEINKLRLKAKHWMAMINQSDELSGIDEGRRIRGSHQQRCWHPKCLVPRQCARHGTTMCQSVVRLADSTTLNNSIVVDQFVQLRN